jgi:tetrahydromethanopterin S-methyltransferase subunit A
MKASPFINNISDEAFDALFDYYNMMECINEINVDNDIINNLEEYTQDEFENE